MGPWKVLLIFSFIASLLSIAQIGNFYYFFPQVQRSLSLPSPFHCWAPLSFLFCYYIFGYSNFHLFFLCIFFILRFNIFFIISNVHNCLSQHFYNGCFKILVRFQKMCRLRSVDSFYSFLENFVLITSLSDWLDHPSLTSFLWAPGDFELHCFPLHNTGILQALGSDKFKLLLTSYENPYTKIQYEK